ncbi:protein activator of alkane oxidation PraB [Caulobacter radicis]|uniref:protein activator of alkane oxidation PraB n=1 Tax=Caulobacter radicis TaxID=2172650 RepID=UPI001057DD2A|nr:protein activator of alkane oxidation PraB [Caulobacter radicis]
MIKCAAVLSAAIALATAGAASSASAATFTPSPVANFTLSGNLTVSHPQATSVDCSVEMTGSIDTSGATAVISSVAIQPGDWACGYLLTASGAPWIVLPTSTSSVMIWMGFTSPWTCGGATTASWTNGAPSTVTFSGATVPGSPGCSVTGTLTASHSVTIM